jgi:ATPase subunit of ABC transporter with duplicated ATPase domains
MSTLLQARGVTHSVGVRSLFSDLSFTVGAGARIALVGHNGCGKTTLLDLLAGARKPDSGEIIVRRGLVVGRVEQFLPQTAVQLSVVDAVRSTPAASSPPPRWRAEALLLELGITTAAFELPAGALSGGQQNRLMFARAVIAEPDLLLLDEPTNHLDLATLRVFEAFLGAYRGGIVLVSHDRAFLDTVSDTTWFLRDGAISCFDLPFSAARAALAEADDAALRTRSAEERKIDALRASAKRLATWGRVYDNEKFAKRAKSMEKRVERMEEGRTFVTSGSPLDLSLDLAAVRSKEIVRVEHLRVTPREAPAQLLFEIDSLLVRPGERIALLGANGVGKSTFIRALIGAARGSDTPGIRLSPQVQLGYYDQELDETASDESLVGFVTARVDASDDLVRRRLINAGFAYRDHDKALARMSGGERARALFVVLSMRAPNFLILDEPTNHIDIEGKEQLEQQLTSSNATVLITSHDRRFLDAVAQRFLWIYQGRLIEVNDPVAFYEAPESVHAPDTIREAPPPVKQGDVLTRIVELEALLEADRARKARFQKPELQRQWQEEIARLYVTLD